MRRDVVEVVVDRRVLDAFKRRALKAYPKEYAEQIWGKIKNNSAHIYGFEALLLEQQDKNSVDFDFDQRCGDKYNGLTLLGSIHTHPGIWFGTFPSDDDIASSSHDREIIWGIYAIRKANKRKHTACRFYATTRGEVEFVVSE